MVVFISVVNENFIAKYIDRFGRKMILENENDRTEFQGFLQPLRYKNKMYLSGTLTEIGYDTLRKFVLICPSDIDITTVDGINVLLRFENDDYCVDHCEKVYFKNTPLYYWAIVHQNNNWRDYN